MNHEPNSNINILKVETSSESQLQQMLQESIEDDACILDWYAWMGALHFS